MYFFCSFQNDNSKIGLPIEYRVNPGGVQHALFTAVECCVSSSQQQRLQLALESLPVCSSPAVVWERPGLWSQFCRGLQLSSEQVISHNKAALVAANTVNYTHSATNAQIVMESCRVGGTLLYPSIIQYLFERLDDPRLLDVTDEEYAIFQIPEGELYHQELVDEAFEINVDTKHVKKSSKVYSHKEQVLMLEEKKAEIERKKKDGTLELTAKQKEVKRVQMEKEDAIRKKVSDIVSDIPDLISLLTAVVDGANPGILSSLGPLVQLLVTYFKSTVVGPTYARLFAKLGSHVATVEQATFGALVGRITPCLMGANLSKLPTDWRRHNAKHEALRALERMYEITVPEGADLLDDEEENYFNAPTFVYCFPLLQYVLNNLDSVAAYVIMEDESESDEDEEEDVKPEQEERAEETKVGKVARLGLQIISEHMCMRGDSASEPSQDLHHPRLLPLKQLLELVINVIGQSSGRTHSMACGVLCEICACGSGGIGCHVATPEEINTLLNTLTAPSASVRDAALRGLDVLSTCLPKYTTDQAGWLLLCHRLWVARHDKSQEVKEQADQLWAKIDMKLDDKILEPMMLDLLQPVPAVRAAAALAMGAFIEDNRRNLLKKTINSLIATYKEKSKVCYKFFCNV